MRAGSPPRSKYLDTHDPPLATIRLGCMLASVGVTLSLPFVDRATGAPASAGDIRAEWQRITSRPDLGRLGWREAQKLCCLRLSPEGVERLAFHRLEATAADLLRRFPGLSGWPAAAQLAVCSMAWAMGSGWPKMFPNCSGRLDALDFATVATECDIRVTAPRR